MRNKIWNDETGSSFQPQGGAWKPQKPDKPNDGNYHDQGSDPAPNVKRVEDSDQDFHIRDKM